MVLFSAFHAAVVGALLLALAGAVHIYWAMSGVALKAGAIPEANGRPVLHPSAPLTALVGLALFAAAAFTYGLSGRWGDVPPLGKLGGLGLALVFLVRAVGDFKFVGVFKRVVGTTFARRDTLYYVPLCLVLAVLIGRATLG